MTDRLGVAIIGPGNIGTDLLFKIKRGSDNLEVLAMVGIDPNSDGLARARRLGVATTSDGIAEYHRRRDRITDFAAAAADVAARM